MEPVTRVLLPVCAMAMLLLGVATLRGQTFTKITSGIIVNDPGGNRAVTWIDYDRDGNLDMFVTRGGDAAGENNALYHNDGPPFYTFTKKSDVILSQDFSPSVGCSWGDYDNDGYPDLVVVNWAGKRTLFYHNNGDGTFALNTSTPITHDFLFSATAAWGDYDNDGLLDLYITNYKLAPNELFKNLGAGVFQRVLGAPIVTDAGSAQDAAWGDADGDGDIDLFVSHNNNQTSLLYLNRLVESGVDTFSSVRTGPVVTTPAASQSGAWGDYDNDGDLDLFVANWNNQKAFLYRNDGSGNFTAVTGDTLVNEPEYAACGVWGDIDNDGDLDLVVTHDFNGNPSNGIYIYKNMLMETGVPYFQKISAGDVGADVGWSHAASFGDYNNDGFLDLFVTKTYGEYENNVLFLNDGNSNHWLKIDCIGTASNRSAIGAKVRLKATIGGKPVWQLRVVEGQNAYQSQNLQLHFGLGDALLIDSLIVEWPSSPREVFTNLPVNRHVQIAEHDSTAAALVFPPDGAVNQNIRPVLRWMRQYYFAPFHVQVSIDSTFAGGFIVDDTLVTDTSRAVDILTNHSTYFWRVMPLRSVHMAMWSPVRRFTNDIPPPAIPQLLTPADGSVNQPVVRVLAWSNLHDASRYHLQVAADSLFASLVVNDSTLTDTSGQESFAHLMKYFWRVNAASVGGESPFSPSSTFTTVIDTPGIPQPLIPADSSVGIPVTPSLQWNAAPRGDEYRLELCTDSTFSHGVVASVDTTLSRQAGPLSYRTKYFWRVTAANAGGSGSSSAVRRFTTIVGIPLLLHPPSGGGGQPDDVTLIWSSVPGASAYNVVLGTDSMFQSAAVANDTLADTSLVVRSLENKLTYYWRARAFDAVLSGGWSGVSRFTANFDTAHTAVVGGWNIVALPVIPANGEKDSLFPAAVSPAYAYDSAGGYVQAETLTAGKGYWLRFSGAADIPVVGITMQSETVAVASGWNLIGTTQGAVDVSTIESDPPGMVTADFFGYNGHYRTADTLVPGRGYWVKTGAGGRLIFSGPAMQTSARRIRIIPGPDLPPEGPAHTSGLGTAVPRAFALRNAYPNPFNPVTRIGIDIPKSADVLLAVYDLLGKKVATLVDRTMGAGSYTIEWNGLDVHSTAVPSGIYLVRLKAGAFDSMEKVMLLR